MRPLYAVGCAMKRSSRILVAALRISVLGHVARVRRESSFIASSGSEVGGGVGCETRVKDLMVCREEAMYLVARTVKMPGVVLVEVI